MWLRQYGACLTSSPQPQAIAGWANRQRGALVSALVSAKTALGHCRGQRQYGACLTISSQPQVVVGWANRQKGASVSAETALNRGYNASWSSRQDEGWWVGEKEDIALGQRGLADGS